MFPTEKPKHKNDGNCCKRFPSSSSSSRDLAATPNSSSDATEKSCELHFSACNKFPFTQSKNWRSTMKFPTQFEYLPKCLTSEIIASKPARFPVGLQVKVYQKFPTDCKFENKMRIIFERPYECRISLRRFMMNGKFPCKEEKLRNGFPHNANDDSSDTFCKCSKIEQMESDAKLPIVSTISKQQPMTCQATMTHSVFADDAGCAQSYGIDGGVDSVQRQTADTKAKQQYQQTRINENQVQCKKVDAEDQGDDQKGRKSNYYTRCVAQQENTNTYKLTPTNNDDDKENTIVPIALTSSAKKSINISQIPSNQQQFAQQNDDDFNANASVYAAYEQFLKSTNITQCSPKAPAIEQRALITNTPAEIATTIDNVINNINAPNNSNNENIRNIKHQKYEEHEPNTNIDRDDDHDGDDGHDHCDRDHDHHHHQRDNNSEAGKRLSSLYEDELKQRVLVAITNTTTCANIENANVSGSDYGGGGGCGGDVHGVSKSAKDHQYNTTVASYSWLSDYLTSRPCIPCEKSRSASPDNRSPYRHRYRTHITKFNSLEALDNSKYYVDDRTVDCYAVDSYRAEYYDDDEDEEEEKEGCLLGTCECIAMTVTIAQDEVTDEVVEDGGVGGSGVISVGSIGFKQEQLQRENQNLIFDNTIDEMKFEIHNLKGGGVGVSAGATSVTAATVTTSANMLPSRSRADLTKTDYTSPRLSYSVTPSRVNDSRSSSQKPASYSSKPLVDVDTLLPESTRLRRQRRLRSQESLDGKPQQDEDPIARLNRLKARISGALSEVKGVLKQYSTDAESETPSEAESQSSLVPRKSVLQRTAKTEEETPRSDDAVNFRFVKKVRRRSIFNEAEKALLKEEEKEKSAKQREQEQVQEHEKERKEVMKKEETLGSKKEDDSQQYIKESNETKQENISKSAEDSQPEKSIIVDEISPAFPEEKVGIIIEENSTTVDEISPALPEESSSKEKIGIIIEEKSSNELGVHEKEEQSSNDHGNIPLSSPTTKANKAKKKSNQSAAARRASIAAVEATAIELPTADIKLTQRRPSDSETVMKRKCKTSPKEKSIKVKQPSSKLIKASAIATTTTEKPASDNDNNKFINCAPSSVPSTEANNSNKDVAKTTVADTATAAAAAVVAAATEELKSASPAVNQNIQAPLFTNKATKTQAEVLPKQLESINDYNAAATTAADDTTAVAAAVTTNDTKQSISNDREIKANANNLTQCNFNKTDPMVIGVPAIEEETSRTRMPQQHQEQLDNQLLILLSEEATLVKPANNASAITNHKEINKDGEQQEYRTHDIKEIPASRQNEQTLQDSLLHSTTIKAEGATATADSKELINQHKNIPATSVNKQQQSEQQQVSPSKTIATLIHATESSHQTAIAPTPTAPLPPTPSHALDEECGGGNRRQSTSNAISDSLAVDAASVDDAAVSSRNNVNSESTKISYAPSDSNSIVPTFATLTTITSSSTTMPDLLQTASTPVQAPTLLDDHLLKNIDTTDASNATAGNNKRKIVIKKVIRKNSTEKAPSKTELKTAESKVQLPNLLFSKGTVNKFKQNEVIASPPTKTATAHTAKQTSPAPPANESETIADEEAKAETVENSETVPKNESVEPIPVPEPVKRERKIKKKVIIKRQKRRLSISENTFFKETDEASETANNNANNGTTPETETLEKAIAYVTDDEDEVDDAAVAKEAAEAAAIKMPLKSCLRSREFQVGDAVMYAERYRKTQVRWKKGVVLERITSISYKLDIEGKEVAAHISYIKKYTDRKVNFGGKEYLEIDYEQVAEEEKRARSYSIWNMV